MLVIEPFFTKVESKVEIRNIVTHKLHNQFLQWKQK